jgi:hypothetical protein
MKLPNGKGYAAYYRKSGDEWNGMDVRHHFQVTVDGPKEIMLPAAIGKDDE